MGDTINNRNQIYSSVNGFVTIWTYDADTDSYSPGEKIEVRDFVSTALLDTNGVIAWQTMLKMAIASDSLKSLNGANAFTQTDENGVYITTVTTTNLPDTNLVGTLEVYNSGTTKYLCYKTFNVGRIEIWTNYYNGSSWGTWDYSNGSSSDTAEDGITKTNGVFRLGGTLTDDVEIDLAGFIKSIIGQDSEFSVEIGNTGPSLSSKLIIGANVVLSYGDYAITIDDEGLQLSDYPLILNQRALPSNDAALAVGNSVYYTDANTTNLPSTTKIGILECFDHAESGDVSLRYTTFNSGTPEIWGRKKSGVSWTTWAQISGSGVGASNFDQLTDTPADKTGSANKYLKVNSDEDEIIYLGLEEISAEIDSLTEKTDIHDNDIFLAEDSEDIPTAFTKIKIAFSSIKSTLKTYFDSLYASLAQVLARQIYHGFYSLPAAPSFTGNVYSLPGSTPYSVYIGGIKYDIDTAKTIDISGLAEWGSLDFNTRQGQWFIWMYISGGVPVLGASKTGWDILDETAIPVDTAYANDNGAGAIEWIIGKEKHSAKRNLLMHKQEHDTDGARWVSGLNSLTIGSGAANNSTNTFSLAGGVIRDEDIYHTISNSQTQARIAYKNGSTNAFKFDAAGATYAKLNSGAPRYDNAGTLTDIDNGKYGIIWQYATNRITAPIVHILGQAQYASVSAAQAASLPTFYGITVAEWKLINRIIIKNQAGALNWIQSDPLYQVTSGPAVGGGGVSQLPAGNVTLNPFGTVSSVQVQSGLEEIEKDAVIYKPTTQPSIVLGSPNLLTLDCNNYKQAMFEPRESVGTLTIDIDFDIDFTNDSTTDFIEFVLSLTGERVLSFPSDVICNNESSSGSWNNSTQELTLVTTTDEIIKFQLSRYTTNSKLILSVSEKAV